MSKRMSKLSLRIAAAALCSLTLVACGESAPPSPAGAPGEADRGPHLAALSRLRDDYNAVVFTSPQEMVKTFPVVLVGTISSVSPGRSTVVDHGEGTGVRDSSIVVDITVSKTIEAPASAVVAGHAYVSLPSGVSVVEDGGKAGDDTRPSFEDLAASLPEGTRVVLLSPGPLRQPADPERVLDDPFARLPVLEGVHPQALTVDEGDDELDFWPGRTFDQLLQEVARLG